MMRKIILLILSVVFCVSLYSQKSNKVFMNNFYDGVSYMYEDNYGAALDHWKKAEDKDPENPNVWYNLGVCYKNSSKDRELAVMYLQKALDYVNPNYVWNDHTDKTVPLNCYEELGVALRMIGKYEESAEMLKQAKKVASENGRDDLVASADEEIEITENAKKMLTQKSCKRIEIVNLGDVINSEYSDHSPVITCDGQTLYFTSKRPNIINSREDEKIYVSKKNKNGEWSAPEMLPSPINTKGNNESVVAVSADGKQLFFFRSGSALQGNLYVSEMGDNGTWGKPKHLNSDINTKYRESHVTIAPDGNSLYFTSDRPGGYGGLDIYSIKKLPNGKWSEPQLLPEEVNTPKDEEYPFVHPNGSGIYFNSRGHESTGGYDVFFSRINDDGTFSKAENMCNPINTSDNDICYSLSCDGKTAYIAAIREDSKGEYDIYEIIDKSTETNLIVYKGVVKYADNAIPRDVTVWIKDKTTGEDLGNYDVDSNTGEFLCYLQLKDEYSLTYTKNGESIKESEKTPTDEENDNFKRMGSPISLDDVILPLLNKEVIVVVNNDPELNNNAKSSLDNVNTTAKDMKLEGRDMFVNIEYNEDEFPKDSKQMKNVIDYISEAVDESNISYNQKPTDKNLYNVKISNGSNIAGNDLTDNSNSDDNNGDNEPKIAYSDTLEIYNIYFDFDKADIKPIYKDNLDNLAKFMVDNPAVQIEIGGNTDYVGSDDYNYLLSGRRAMAVKNYLVERGVKQDKVLEKKYGEKNPIADNNSNSERKYNRRVEFKVIQQGTDKYLKVVKEVFNVSSDSDSKSNVTKTYRVQLFALSQSKPVESFGVENLKVKQINGFYKYYIGDFNSRAEAQKALDKIKSKYPYAMILESF